tara:strand:+ start:1109 stop:2914 length:1806 start_codon:yes stop_codon:yes gene_type:complete
MKILSIYGSLPSTVSLIVDNKIVSAVNEERFTRKKNDEVFPRQAIDYCLSNSNITGKDLDAVAIASFICPFDDNLVQKSAWTVNDYVKEQELRWKPFLVDKTDKKLKSLLEIFPEKILLDQYPNNYWKSMFKDPDRLVKHRSGRLKVISDYLKIDQKKVKAIDHHKAHAYYSYYTSNMIGKNVLSFTADGLGDNLNATISTFDENGSWKRHYATDECGIARIYRYITLLLGMKPNEHEFKVMGLAPYGKEKYAHEAFKVFEQTLDVEDTKFVWKIKPTDSYYWFKERLEGIRFDSIAWGLQNWVENLLIKWTKNSIRKYKISNIIYSGGVAMNIKAMGKLAELKEVKNLFVGGSASDESLAIGSGICLSEDLKLKKKEIWRATDFSRIETLYLGPKAQNIDENKIVNNLDKNKYSYEGHPTAKKIARFLSEGKIIGRCADRMEFGQRALGNRSILADPTNIMIKEKINSAIKNRDFWMPFAPIILDTYAPKYLKNPKKMESPHMTIGFQTTELGYKKMIAACHPADKSARPQILEKKHNKKLYEIIEEFSLIKDCGAVLNTSFNLHGYPIVNTPKDAFYVFENSDLDILVLDNFIVKKNEY